MSKLEIIQGPLSSKMSKEEAERALTSNPAFVKGSSYTIDNVEGRWVAAIAAGPPFGADAAEDAPEPTPDDGPPEDLKPDSDKPEPSDSDSEDKPKKDKGEKKGLEAEVKHLTEMLTKIVDALGLGDPTDSPVPGDDMGPGGPDDLGPPPMPPGGPEGGPDDSSKQHIVHERALKPGEAAPGTTPIGAPAFSNVREDHPWLSMVNEAATFSVTDDIGDTPTDEVRKELQSLASEIGYNLRQFQHEVKEGHRVASALISKY